MDENSGREIKARRSSIIWGILCGAAAAVGYTVANTFLRALAIDVDPAWVSSLKGGSTVAIFAPWLVVLVARRVDDVFPPARTIGHLIFAALVVQFGGNWLNQIALGDVGIALVVPLTLGAMIVSSAVMGRILLGESVPPPVAVAMLVLLVSVVLLSMGADQAAQAVRGQQTADATTALIWMRGISAACLSGVSYAVLGISIRAALRTSIPLATPMVLVGLVGLIGLGGLAVAQHGPQVITATTALQWKQMLAAGFFNAMAFLALSQALRSLPVIYVNAVNVSQVAMAAAVGMWFFAEPLTSWLVLGLVVMVAGFTMLMFRRSPQRFSRATPADQSVKI